MKSETRLPSLELRIEGSSRMLPTDRSMRMLRLRRVLEITGLGKTTIYGLQAKGAFPMRVQLTTHSVGWVEEEVLAWLAQRAQGRA